jgi:hypothetical protein
VVEFKEPVSVPLVFPNAVDKDEIVVQWRVSDNSASEWQYDETKSLRKFTTLKRSSARVNSGFTFTLVEHIRYSNEE